MKCQQSFFDGLRDKFSDFEFAMELHFAFGRMNVHVHRRRIDFLKQTTNRVTAFHQRIVITLDECVIDAAIFDGPAIDKNELAFARGAGNSGRAD